MDSQEKGRLMALAVKGEHLGEFKAFMEGFVEEEKERAASELLTTNRDPAYIKADLMAAQRMQEYFIKLLNQARMAEEKLKHGT